MSLPTLDEELRRICPLLFGPGSLRCGGGVGKGWENIVKDLSIAIEAHLRELGAKPGQVVVDQYKEKFGGLRFYVSASDPVIDKLIGDAEKLAYETCETCGKPGTVRGGGWRMTLCDEHAKK